MLSRLVVVVHRVGQAVAVVLGLVALLAVVLGPAALGFAAVGDPLTLGKPNNAAGKLTSLAAGLAGPVLRLTNKGAGPALELRVDAGKPPLKVNSGARVANLNADRLDGIDGARILHADTPTYLSLAPGETGGNQLRQVRASCDPGDLLLAGGWFAKSANGAVDNAFGREDFFVVDLRRLDGTSASVTVSATCFDFAPLRAQRTSGPEPGIAR